MSRIKCNEKLNSEKYDLEKNASTHCIMTFIKIVFNLKIEFDPQYNSNDSKKPCLDANY